MANSPFHSLEKGNNEMGTTKDIREAVQAELTFDPLVDATDITVRNMNGEVALNGTVPSYPQYLEAAAAQRVAGVKNVHNHLDGRRRHAGP
jgi:osmotically-inducible protein OsmY